MIIISIHFPLKNHFINYFQGRGSTFNPTLSQSFHASDAGNSNFKIVLVFTCLYKTNFLIEMECNTDLNDSNLKNGTEWLLVCISYREKVALTLTLVTCGCCQRWALSAYHKWKLKHLSPGYDWPHKRSFPVSSLNNHWHVALAPKECNSTWLANYAARHNSGLSSSVH